MSNYPMVLAWTTLIEMLGGSVAGAHGDSSVIVEFPHPAGDDQHSGFVKYLLLNEIAVARGGGSGSPLCLANRWRVVYALPGYTNQTESLAAA